MAKRPTAELSFSFDPKVRAIRARLADRGDTAADVVRFFSRSALANQTIDLAEELAGMADRLDHQPPKIRSK